MTIRLKRDATGVIKNVNNPIILRGGHYDLFQQDSQGKFGLLDLNNHDRLYDVSYTAVANQVPCGRMLPSSVYQDTWGGAETNWDGFFQSCATNNINLLRIFASDGTRLSPNGDFLDVMPFQIDTDPHSKYCGKYKVRQAAENTGVDAMWNMDYFNRLRTFAQIANQHNICLMVTIFNSFDLSDEYTPNVFAAWNGTFWNPANTNDPNWGNDHLVQQDGSGQRQHNFIVPNNNIHYVQYALIKRIVKSLTDCGNVIFEIMNEPRQVGIKTGTAQYDYHELVDFYTIMIRWIREQFTSAWNPMICINDFNFFEATQSEMDYWLAHRTSAYDLFDMISYHGLTAKKAHQVPVCGGSEDIALTDGSTITERYSSHRANHKTKAIVFSTDGASILRLKHHNDSAEMNIVDGQIDTNLTITGPPADVSLRVDLHDWATWCYQIPYSGAMPPYGVAHFQNHSSFVRSFEKINSVFGPGFRS